MTLFLVDIASYQHTPDPINLAAAKAQGVSLVNIKTTQGVRYTFTAGRIYADQARALGMGVCTFHYLTNEASGAAQADYAWKQILYLGGPQGMAHECDCETNATEAIYRDYVKAMQDKMGRHILTYSGDWWWQPRGWFGADLTPYYTAAPNAGYLSAYPGDTSPHWRAGYGGWGDMAMMQYAVGPMAGVGGGNLSQSAIRYPAIWAALTGGDMLTPDDIPTLQVSPWQYKNPDGVADWAKTKPGVWYPDMHAVVWDIYRTVQALQEKVAALELGGIDVNVVAEAVAAAVGKREAAADRTRADELD